MKEVQAGCRRPPTGKARVSSFLFLAFPVPLRKRGWDRTVCSALETRGAMWKQGNNQGAAASPRGSTTSSSVFTPLTPPTIPPCQFFPRDFNLRHTCSHFPRPACVVVVILAERR